MMSGAGAVELAALSLLWWLVEMAGQDAEPIVVCASGKTACMHTAVILLHFTGGIGMSPLLERVTCACRLREATQ